MPTETKETTVQISLENASFYKRGDIALDRLVLPQGKQQLLVTSCPKHVAP
jgi:hypothetical protein